MHWGPYFALDSFEMTCQSYTLPEGQGTFNDDFHVFGLYWDEVGMGMRCPPPLKGVRVRGLP